jgi:small subunit ribosomal protein S16
MLAIRLHRIGKKNQPSFKIVVVDKRRSAAAGKFCEEVGSLNRAKKESRIDKERIKYWLSVGAQPSPSIHNLLVSEKLLDGKKIAVHKKPKKTAAEATAKAPEVKA